MSKKGFRGEVGCVCHFSLLFLPQRVQQALSLPLLLLLHVVVAVVDVHVVGTAAAPVHRRLLIRLHVLIVGIRIAHISIHYIVELIN